MRRCIPFVAGSVAAAGVALLGTLALTFGRPPQPLPFGTIQWLGEVGATVDRVDRVTRIAQGARSLSAKGEFYIVHARILAPFGLRPTWNDAFVEVDTFAHSGATMPPMRFTIDKRAQALLDQKTGRPGAEHLIRGAVAHEDLVFDLPRNVEQPGLVFLPANSPAGMLEWPFGHFWQPHRFNLRYD